MLGVFFVLAPACFIGNTVISPVILKSQVKVVTKQKKKNLRHAFFNQRWINTPVVSGVVSSCWINCVQRDACVVEEKKKKKKKKKNKYQLSILNGLRL